MAPARALDYVFIEASSCVSGPYGGYRRSHGAKPPAVENHPDFSGALLYVGAGEGILAEMCAVVYCFVSHVWAARRGRVPLQSTVQLASAASSGTVVEG